MNSLQTLRALLPANQGDVASVFLADFLHKVGKMPVPVATFDAAASEFQKATQIPQELWTRFLAILVDETGLAKEFEAYAAAEVAAFKAAMAPPAAAPAAKPDALVEMPVAAAVWPEMTSFLTHKKPLPGYNLGDVIAVWSAPHGEDMFQVSLINAEGGPVLVASRYRGGRVASFLKPSYDAIAPFVFDVDGGKVRVQLAPPKP